MALSHNTLSSFYRTNFVLMQHHGYSLHEIEQLIPWEREVYISLLIDHLKQEKERAKTKNRKQ